MHLEKDYISQFPLTCFKDDLQYHWLKCQGEIPVDKEDAKLILKKVEEYI